MQNNIILSIGYPIGMVKNKDNYKFYVECENKQYILEDKESFTIWRIFLGGKSYSYGEKEMLSDLKCNEEICSYVFNKLKNQGLLIELGENLANSYSLIKDKKLFRQGIGIGCNFQKESYYIVLGKLFELSDFEYSIWVMADSKITIEQMMKRLSISEDISKQDIMSLIINLYNKGLVYIY